MRKNSYKTTDELVGSYSKNANAVKGDSEDAVSKNPYSATSADKAAASKNPYNTTDAVKDSYGKNTSVTTATKAAANSVNPSSVTQYVTSISSFGGIDTGLRDTPGVYESCQNLSPLKYPALSTREGREVLTFDEGDFDDIFYWEDNVIVRVGTTLYVDGFDDGGFDGNPITIGTVTNNTKQFAVVNTKLCIFPDAKYIDMTVTRANWTLRDLSADETIPGILCVFLGGDEVRFRCSPSGDLDSIFAKGDTIQMTGGGLPFNNGKLATIRSIEEYYTNHYEIVFEAGTGFIPCEMYKNITGTALAGGVVYNLRNGISGIEYYQFMLNESTDATSELYLLVTYQNAKIVDKNGTILQSVKCGSFESTTAPAGTVINNGVYPSTDTFHMKRNIPDFDYICEADNRLWGVCNSVENTLYDEDGNPYTYKGRCIYASALGDPKSFFQYLGLSTDSYAVGVASDGDFTGICHYTDNVLCWKENEMVKVAGSTPSNYYLTFYKIPGVQDGSWKSLTLIKQVLFYQGIDGIYTWSGATPVCISTGLTDDDTIRQGVGGTDGRQYFLCLRSTRDSRRSLYVFDTVNKIWTMEDHIIVKQMFFAGKHLFASIAGDLYKFGANTTESFSWGMITHPMFSDDSSSPNFGTKRYLRMLIRGELITNSSGITVYVKMDGGSFVQIGTKSGAGEFKLLMPIPAGRSDRITVKLIGSGYCTVRDIQVVYGKGSDIP